MSPRPITTTYSATSSAMLVADFPLSMICFAVRSRIHGYIYCYYLAFFVSFCMRIVYTSILNKRRPNPGRQSIVMRILIFIAFRLKILIYQNLFHTHSHYIDKYMYFHLLQQAFLMSIVVIVCLFLYPKYYIYLIGLH